MNGLFANALYTIHQGKSGGRGLSPRLWARVLGQDLSPDGFSNAYMVGDDFLTFGGLLSGTAGGYAGQAGWYTSYQDSGNTITQLATEVGGVASIATDGTDNDESWMQPGSATSVMGKISSTAGASKLMIFETRFRISKVSDTHDFFVGLTEEGTAAADFISDADAISDKDRLGFHVLAGAGTALKFGWKKAGQTAVSLMTAATIAAATWYKVGFIYDPVAPSAKRLKVFVDNVEQSTYGTNTQLTAATFPDGEELNALFGIKNGAGSATTLDLDWWNFFQAGV